jgi:hypothetical protein
MAHAELDLEPPVAPVRYDGARAASGRFVRERHAAAHALERSFSTLIAGNTLVWAVILPLEFLQALPH